MLCGDAQVSWPGGNVKPTARESEASSTWRGFTRPEAKSERRGTEGVSLGRVFWSGSKPWIVAICSVSLTSS